MVGDTTAETQVASVQGSLTMVEMDLAGRRRRGTSQSNSLKRSPTYRALLVQAGLLLRQSFLLRTTRVHLMSARGSLASTKILDSGEWSPMRMPLTDRRQCRIFCVNYTPS